MANLEESRAEEQVTAAPPAAGKAAGRQGDRLTRPVVAELLQVSVATVRRLEGTALHPQKGPDGIYIFEPDEVQEVARKRPQVVRPHAPTPGEVAAAAFALFKKGTRPPDVVIELERPPEEIERLHAQWERLSDRLVLSEETVQALSRMASAQLLDVDLVNCLLNDDAESIRAITKEKLKDRVARRRDL